VAAGCSYAVPHLHRNQLSRFLQQFGNSRLTSCIELTRADSNAREPPTSGASDFGDMIVGERKKQGSYRDGRASCEFASCVRSLHSQL